MLKLGLYMEEKEKRILIGTCSIRAGPKRSYTKGREGETERQTGRQRQRDRRTDGRTDRDRKTDRQTEGGRGGGGRSRISGQRD